MQEVNERNFKLLQEYLAAADERRGSGGSASLPYKFTFYLPEESTESSDRNEEGDDKDTNKNNNNKDTSDDDDTQTSLQQISLTLPPPTRSSPQTTLKALAKLLITCGISLQETDTLSSLTQQSSSTSLKDFIPQAAEQFHQATTQQGGPRHELHAVRMALKMTHRITLVFGGDLASAIPSQQLAMAMKLIRVLEQHTKSSKNSDEENAEQYNDSSIAHLKIGISNRGFAIDPSGTLWLHSHADENAWLEFLNSSNIQECHKKRLHDESIRRKEVDVAKLLGISAVIYMNDDNNNNSSRDDENSCIDAYEAFLQKVLDQHVSTTQLSSSSTARGVTLCVVPANTNDPIQCTTDSTGKIFVPVTISAPSLFAMVKKLTPEASRCAALQRKEEEALSALRSQVERKLKLRQLLRHPDLPSHKFKAACLRMLSNSSTLMPLVDGLSLRIAEVNGFVPGQSQYIDIAWNFQ